MPLNETSTFNMAKTQTIIINLTLSMQSENVAEVMFHATNEDWFTAIFPKVDVDFPKMHAHYVGKDFYQTKRDYKGRIFSEADFQER
jgi:hypothetical protein